MMLWLLPFGGLVLLAFALAWWLRRRSREIGDADKDEPFEPPLITGQYPGGLP